MDYAQGLEGIRLCANDREVLHMAGVAYKEHKYWYAWLRGKWYFLVPGQGTATEIAYVLQEVPTDKVPSSIIQKVLSP